MRLYVAGAGGHARELHSYIEDLRRAGWPGEVVGFLDDGLPTGLHGKLTVLGAISTRVLPKLNRGFFYITALGSNLVRRRVVERIEELYGNALKPWTLIHPSAYIGEEIEIGAGTSVAPGAILTAKISLGRHCMVNVKASVSHDCIVGDYVNINPSATVCGSVTVGEGAYIGAGATVIERVTIGAWSIIGAGSVVTRDIPANVTAVGVPARIIKSAGLLPCQVPAAR